jgi:hypothetical protein
MVHSDPEIVEATLAQPSAQSKATEPQAGRYGISIASLFVVTTAAAVLVVGIAPVVQQLIVGEVEVSTLILVLGCGTLGGFLLGLLQGMHRYYRGLGALQGGVVGAGLGLLVSPLALLPTPLIRPVGTAMFIGSLLMIAVAIVMRPGRR